jgi:hypothetical protein
MGGQGGASTTKYDFLEGRAQRVPPRGGCCEGRGRVLKRTLAQTRFEVRWSRLGALSPRPLPPAAT